MREAPSATSDAELISATPSRTLFPGEDRGAYAAFRLALLEELAPVTFYERHLAETLFDLEWEVVRYRNLRTTLVTAEARDRSANAIEKSVNQYSFEPSKQSIAIADELFKPNGSGDEAATILRESAGTNLDEIVARAYAKEIGTLSHIERHLADIEPRRRRLLDDYDRLKARRSQNIPDAEIVDDDGD